MDTSELLKKVRKIEIKTRGLSRHIFAGEYHSAFKGRGMAFSEVREYGFGDDIRNIDWNVTARYDHPFVKIFEEERELTVMILADLSGSQEFGTRNNELKRTLVAELAAVIAFSAIQNNDKVGLILFTDKVEKYIAPKKGKTHILRIIRELLEFTPENTGTDIAEALRYCTNVIKKRSTAFIISDFEAPDYSTALQIANRKHDMVALRVYDRHEENIPNIGFVQLFDPETGKSDWFDTSSFSVRKAYDQARNKQRAVIYERFKRAGVDYTELQVGKDYVVPLMNLFKKR